VCKQAAIAVLLLISVPAAANDAYKLYANNVNALTALPDGLLPAICGVESRWRKGAIGAHGEIGLCQIKVDTVRMTCPKKKCLLGLLRTKNLEKALHDPYMNMWLAANYLVWLREELRTNDQDVLAAAYNAGPAGASVDYMMKVRAEMQR
jgi:soluble lytic murein transglycosylase-like protein